MTPVANIIHTAAIQTTLSLLSLRHVSQNHRSSGDRGAACFTSGRTASAARDAATKGSSGMEVPNHSAHIFKWAKVEDGTEVPTEPRSCRNTANQCASHGKGSMPASPQNEVHRVKARSLDLAVAKVRSLHFLTKMSFILEIMWGGALCSVVPTGHKGATWRKQDQRRSFRADACSDCAAGAVVLIAGIAPGGSAIGGCVEELLPPNPDWFTDGGRMDGFGAGGATGRWQN